MIFILFTTVYRMVKAKYQFTPKLLRSAMAGRLYKLQSKHTSNSGFDQTFMPCSGYILFAACNVRMD